MVKTSRRVSETRPTWNGTPREGAALLDGELLSKQSRATSRSGEQLDLPLAVTDIEQVVHRGLCENKPSDGRPHEHSFADNESDECRTRITSSTLCTRVEGNE